LSEKTCIDRCIEVMTWYQRWSKPRHMPRDKCLRSITVHHFKSRVLWVLLKYVLIFLIAVLTPQCLYIIPFLRHSWAHCWPFSEMAGHHLRKCQWELGCVYCSSFTYVSNNKFGWIFKGLKCALDLLCQTYLTIHCDTQTMVRLKFVCRKEWKCAMPTIETM
jgi:hypothetical protein